MKKITLILLLVLLTTSCSINKMANFFAKKPKINYVKPENFKSLNKYEKDAVFLTELVKQTYPRLYSKIPEIEYEKATQKFISDAGRINNKTDFEILTQRFMALLKDGHSNVMTLSFYEDKKLFPIYLLPEKEQWAILNVEKAVDSAVIGSKIVSVNDIPIDSINNRIEKFNSGENSKYRLNPFGYQIQYPKFWEAIGITPSENELKITSKHDTTLFDFIIKASEKRTYYKIKSKDNKYPLTNLQNDGFFYKVNQKDDFAYLQMNTCLDLVALKDGMGNYTNLLTRPIAMLWAKSETRNARNFGITLQSLFKEAEEKQVNNLIIDLRYNGGGDETLGKQLLWYLTEEDTIKGFNEFLNVSDYFKKRIKKDYKYYNSLYQKKYGKPIPNGEVNLSKTIFEGSYFSTFEKEDSPYLLDSTIPKFKGKVYLIIGPNTFSAAAVLATTFLDNNVATLVGRPTGNKPTTQTGASIFKLPHTKTIVQISYTYFERPNTAMNDVDALYPDIEAYPTFESGFEGNDVAFDYIMTEIKNNSNEK